MILFLPWLVGAGAVASVLYWVFSDSEEEKEAKKAKKAKEEEKNRQKEIKNAEAKIIWESIEKLGKLLELKSENYYYDITGQDIKIINQQILDLQSINDIWLEMEEKSLPMKNQYFDTVYYKNLTDNLEKWNGLSQTACRYLEYLEAAKSELEYLINLGIPNIDKMEGFDFEKILLVHFARMSYKGSLTPKTQDFGADLILMKDGKKYVIQAKRSASVVSLKAIQEIVAAKGYYNADKAIVVTNNYFTENAKELAYRNTVELWDRDKLIKFIAESKNIE